MGNNLSVKNKNYLKYVVAMIFLTYSNFISSISIFIFI